MAGLVGQAQGFAGAVQLLAGQQQVLVVDDAAGGVLLPAPGPGGIGPGGETLGGIVAAVIQVGQPGDCLLYTSDAADE